MGITFMAFKTRSSIEDVLAKLAKADKRLDSSLAIS